MNPRDQARLTEILNQHDAIARALRDSSDAFDRVMEHLQAAAAATHVANEGQRVAIDAMLAANRAALALLNESER